MKIDKNNIPELIGQIIDIFEDFLDEKGIVIENEDRDFNEDIEPEETANIYGSDYDNLADQIKDTLTNWDIIEKE